MIVPLALGLVGYAVATQPHARERVLGVVGSGSLSAADMYDRIRDGAGFTGLLTAQTNAAILAAKYAERVRQIESLRTRMAEHWTGDASDSALRYSQPFSDAMRDAGDTLTAIAGESGPLLRQTDAYQQVLINVEKLPATPPESGLLNTVNPFETDTDREINAYNDKATRNVAAYLSYYSASGDNGSAMPQAFPAPPDTTVPAVAVLPQTGQGGQQFSAQVPTVPAAPAAVGGLPAAGGLPAGGASAAGGGPPVGSSAGDPARMGSTSQQSVTPGPTSVPAPVTGTPQPSAGGTGVPFGMVPGGGGAGAGRPGVGTGRPGGGGSGPGSGGPGSGGPGSGRLGSGGSPGGGGPGGGSGARGMAEPLGRTTSSTGVGPAAGRQRKDAEEDEERSSKYVLSEELDLGTSEIVAPPVIGDTR